jgi:hypothetical protein
MQLDGRWELTRDRNALAIDTTGGSNVANKRDGADAVRAEWNALMAKSIAATSVARVIRLLCSLSSYNDNNNNSSNTAQYPPHLQALPSRSSGIDLGSVASSLLPNLTTAQGLFKDVAAGAYEMLSDPRRSVCRWPYFLQADVALLTNNNSTAVVRLEVLRSALDPMAWGSPDCTLFRALATKEHEKESVR